MEGVIQKPGLNPLLIEHALHWRYATKVFDKQKKVPEDQFELLLESLRLAPSSIGLQPWKFVVVKRLAFRKEMMQLSVQQAQMTDASHLIVLCSLQNINEDYIDRLIQLEKAKNSGRSALEEFKPLTLSFIKSKSTTQLREWLAEQVYIALGFLLSACALLHIDACPIEAFDHGKVNKLLELHKLGIQSRVAVAIGYRSENDPYASRKKVRWPIEDVVITV
jgi:nitroreductase / dihydropteridine reductase